MNEDFLKHLSLPGRFEQLQRESLKTGSDISGIIQPVKSACNEIEITLREIQTSGLGRLLILHGTSGSGKSTFLHGLKYFFDNVDIISFKKEQPILSLATFISNDTPKDTKHRIYVIDDRDNPNETDSDLKVSFEALRNLFRIDQGKALIVWPITDLEVSTKIAEMAWHIGRDSLLGTRYKRYDFTGLSKDNFSEVADITTRSLNAGENLESFGIGSETAMQMARESETIGEFYSRLNAYSAQRNSQTYNILKTKIRPRVWIVVPGDDSKELDRTVSSLTQGTRNRLDIDKIAEFLDNKDNKSNYLNDWRKRRNDMAYLMRILDVRLFELTPNAALAAVRTYGAEKIKTDLKKKTEKIENCIETIAKTRVGQAILNPEESLTFRPRETADEMAKEYMTIQQLAAKGDNALNLSLSEALKEFLLKSGNDVTVTCEKQNLPNSQLCPDIQIPLTDGSIVCLELTWRSTGKHIATKGERRPQNTLSPGHIMMYLLDKSMEYVKDLKLSE
ncbi:hypothetical protein [uncultured Fluviicola sp.]|uniref:hypothetical protein n=1 Tax=uncultured Fluviicola sp. TaxID=463303 RepID=UPI0025E8D1DD|nr:hypothetical protein [uncultured Fluviicola sp.]